MGITSKKYTIKTIQKILPDLAAIHLQYCKRNNLNPSVCNISESWPNNCYAVATALVDLLPLTARTAYGFWYGTDVRNPGEELSRHGWALLNGFVLDPTRWVFEQREPYLFVQKTSKAKEYDEGMTQLREAFEHSSPKRDLSQKQFAFKWDLDETTFLTNLFGESRSWNILTCEECFWIANKPPKRILPIVESFYKQLKGYDLLALVPIDFRAMLKDFGIYLSD